MKISIRHFPFNFAPTADEVDDMLAEECLRAGQDTPVDMESLTGYDEFHRASEAMHRVSETVETAPENLRLLHFLASHAIRYIGRESSTGPAAPRCLLALAQYIINLLEAQPNEFLQELAQTRLDWPCLVTLKDLAKPRIKKRQGESWGTWDWLNSIQLGAACPVKASSSVDANRLARSMIDTIEENRRMVAQRKDALKLKKFDPPEFNRRFKLYKFPAWALKCGSLRPLKDRVWKEWFEVGWEALLDVTRGCPENYSVLRRIGQYRENTKVQKNRRKNAKTRDITKTVSSHIRDGIKWKVRDAFRRITNV